MIKIKVLLLILLLVCTTALAGGNEKSYGLNEKKGNLTYLELREQVLNNPSSGLFEFGFDLSGRKVQGLIYSTFIPGAGQMYLGHTYKGAIFSILTFGALVTTVISQNDLVAMNERLESLETDYKQANTYTKANEIWVKMLTVKSDADSYYKNRKTFLGISIGLWALNLLDYMFLTPDKGTSEFSQKGDRIINLTSGYIHDTPSFGLSLNF